MRLITTEEFIIKAKFKHNNKYDYSKSIYKKGNEDIEIICPIHDLFTQKASSHLAGIGCNECGDDAALYNKSNTLEFIEKSNIIHNNKYTYKNVIYINNKTDVTITCSLHGDFPQTPNSHLAGKGCKMCSNSTSKGEIEWLDWLNIPNDSKYRQIFIYINDKKYVADGFDPITNTIYEYNGDFWHGNPAKYKPEDINKKNKKTYGELYQATLKKEQDLINVGYKVINTWGSSWYKFKKLRKLVRERKTWII